MQLHHRSAAKPRASLVSLQVLQRLVRIAQVPSFPFNQHAAPSRLFSIIFYPRGSDRQTTIGCCAYGVMYITQSSPILSQTSTSPPYSLHLECLRYVRSKNETPRHLTSTTTSTFLSLLVPESRARKYFTCDCSYCAIEHSTPYIASTAAFPLIHQILAVCNYARLHSSNDYPCCFDARLCRL